MKIETNSFASGKLDWLEVRDKNGKLKTRLENVPNLLGNSAFNNNAGLSVVYSSYAMSSTAESYEDLGGTWNQSGNTVTRATGSAIFPSTPDQMGNELKWGTGERCHITTRDSDTSITVSGPARNITGGTIRRYTTNGSGVGSYTGYQQTNVDVNVSVDTFNLATGVRTLSAQHSYASATVGYTLGSFVFGDGSRIKLPATIVIAVDDQIQFEYTRTETTSARTQVYELGVESVGIPQKHSMLTIVGNGTNVDVTFSAATHFLAGDKLDLRAITPKKFLVSSATSNSTTLTLNTTGAHGLSVADSVTIEGASLAGYNGVFTVATVPDADTVTITNSANPGSMGASGTIRLTTPGTYFDDLGLATITTMVSSSVARITSAITGPTVEPVAMSGDPGVTLVYHKSQVDGSTELTPETSANYAGLHLEGTTKAIASESSLYTADQTGQINPSVVPVLTGANFTNDFRCSRLYTWSSGTGTGRVRVKQFYFGFANNSTIRLQATLNTPFTKTDSQRLQVSFAKQIFRDLP